MNTSANNSDKPLPPDEPRLRSRTWPFLVFVLIATASVAVAFISISRFEQEKAQWLAGEPARQAKLAEVTDVETRLKNLESRRKVIQELEREISSKKGQMEGLDAEFEAKTTSLREARKQLTEVTDQVKSGESRRTALQEQSLGKAKELTELERSIGTTKAERDDVLKEASDAVKRAQEGKAALDRLEKEILEKGRQAQELQSKLGQLVGTVGELEGRRRTLEESVAAERQRARDLDSDIKKLLERKKEGDAWVTQAETARKKAESDAQAAASQLAEVQKRLAPLLGEEGAARSRLDALKSDEARLKGVSEALDKSSRELNITQAALDQARKELQRVSDERTILQASVAGQRAILDKLDQDKRDADEDVSAAKSSVQAATKELVVLESRRNALKDEISVQERALASEREKAQQVSLERDRLLSTVQGLKEAESDIQRKLSQLTLDETRWKELRVQTADMTAKRDDLASRIADLEARLAAARGRSEAAYKSLEGLEAQIAEKRRELDSMKIQDAAATSQTKPAVLTTSPAQNSGVR